MKKLLLSIIVLPAAMQAQVLMTEDFNALTVGNVTDNITNTAPGQGNYFLFASNGASPTLSTNADPANAQIVSIDGPNLALALEGPDGDKGSRYVWKDGFPALWASRTAGNDILEVEVDINPGDGTSASRNTFGIYIFNAVGDRILGGFFVRAATRELFIVGYSTPTGNPVGNYNYALAAAPGIQIPANQVSRIGISYNKTTRAITIKGPGIAASGLSITGSSTNTDPAEIDFISFSGTTTSVTNTESAIMTMDNLVVRASATDTLLGTTEISNQDTAVNVYPNPAQNTINIKGTSLGFNAITITDANGRAVKTLKVDTTTETQMNISDLAPGVYFMAISSESGSVTKKIVKQ